MRVGSPRHLAVALRTDVPSPCVHLWMLGVRQLCVWTVLVLGPCAFVCVGEVLAALLASGVVKTPVYSH